MVGGRAAAEAIAQAFGAGHGADEGCFLKNAVPAHAAAKKGSFDGAFKGGEDPQRDRFIATYRAKGSLIPSRRED
jgi:hypothetical protein